MRSLVVGIQYSKRSKCVPVAVILPCLWPMLILEGLLSGLEEPALVHALLLCATGVGC